MSKGTQALFENYIAGEDLTIEDLVYLSDSRTVSKAKADSSSTMPCIGMALETASQDDSISILLQGSFENLTNNSFTAANVKLYVSADTAGAITETPPAAGIEQEIGISTTTDGMILSTITESEGETGIQGLTGLQGETGTQGIQGTTGLRGETGIQGIQGETGIQGTQGTTGLRGETGIQGIQGETGSQGETGIQGETGLGNFVQGYTEDSAVLVPEIKWDFNDEAFYGYVTGVDKYVQMSSGSLQGSTGTQGETGTQGAQGTQGDQGETGVDYGITGMINVLMDNGADALTGIVGDITLAFNIHVRSWRLTADAAGSMLMGLWEDTFANFPPTSVDAMHGGETGPYLLTGDSAKREVTDTSGWSAPTGAAGNMIRINIDSCTGITRATLAIGYSRF